MLTPEAVPGEATDVLGAATGVDQQLHCDADLPFELVEAGTQVLENLGGQIPSCLLVFRKIRHVLAGEDEVVGESMQWAAGPGQGQGAHPSQHLSCRLGVTEADLAADDVLGLEIGQPVQEGGDVCPLKEHNVPLHKEDTERSGPS
ncbi:hypothetical protein ALMP_62480 [Streptomyces sp. A012304]|nr:hypothetical protein ALMP_62480 [Streptomyces sp. A012304]